MSEFTWLDEYKIGNESVDWQHRRLFELANRLVEANDTAAVTECTMSLYHHIREHFRSEEDLMKQFNYPAYAKHVEAHNQMLDKLVTISNRIHDGTWRRDEILLFMREWVMEHILELDMQLGEFLQQLPQPSLA